MTGAGGATMPAVFFGHGSPMNAIERNASTASWERIGRAIAPRPQAILCISAHWCTRGTGVTAMARPRTIHDFGAFPRELFAVQYPAPGSPALAARVRELLAPLAVVPDQQWGLDHGTWSVLVKAYPEADIPVVQLSMDVALPPARHYEIGRRLAPLREEGVLIAGSGNVVHNLGRMNWDPATPPYPWAQRFHDYVRTAIAEDTPQRVVDYLSQGEDAALAVPSPDHYWPLLYVLGARRPADRVRFEVDAVEHGSLSMLSVVLE